MKITKGRALLFRAFMLLASTGLSASAWAQTSFYVDPTAGDDSAAGTSPSQPFRSLARAQRAVRAANAAMAEDIVVNLRGGTYSLTAPLVLGPADSGTNGHTVIWRAVPGETPVFTSARRIVGWRAVGNGRYRAPVGGFNFRQMFVNGVRATRSRHPEDGSWAQLQGVDRNAKTLGVNSGLVGNWGNLKQVEMNLQLQWSENHMRLSSLTPDGAQNRVKFQDEETAILFNRPYPILHDGSPYFFENALEFVTNPGEFYVSTTQGAVYYIPRAGENLGSASVIAPTLETLVDIRGDSLDAPAHDIRFSGVTFADTTWMYASRHGNLNGQGGNYNLSANMQNDQYVGRPPAAVHAALADRIQFDGNTFTRAGATALDIDHGVHESAVVGNVVHDVSGNGIMIGKFSDPDVEFHTIYNPPSSPQGEDVREVTRDINVLNNVVTRVGRDYYGVSGINAGFVNSVNILNNDVTDIPFAGISLGWGWQKADNALGNNRIDRNNIGNALNVLCDAAGIYHLSNDRGTTVDRNYIHDIYRTPAACGSWVVALYMDEGSGNMTVSNNVLAAISENVRFFANYPGPNLVVTNNDAQNPDTIKAAGLQPGYRSLLQRLNLAYNHPVSASSAADGAAGAVDGDANSAWSSADGDSAAWWQVDLGKAQLLGQITITTRQDQDVPAARTAFEVRGSNDPTFTDYVVLTRQDSKTAIPFAGMTTRQIKSQMPYRYVRIAKTTAGPLALTDVSVQAGGGEIVDYGNPNFDPNRFYTIKNVNSGKLLSVDGGNKAAGTRLIQWDANGAPDQQFQIVRVSGNLYKIVARHSGMAINPSGASPRSGTSLIQWPFENNNHELWYFQPAANGSWVIRNFADDLAFDVAGGSRDRGAAVNQWMTVSQPNQQWIIE